MAEQKKKRPLIKRMFIMIGCVLVLVAMLAFGKYLQIQKLIAAAPKPGAQTVSAMVVKKQQWRPELAAVGTLSPVRGADLASEVDGLVERVNFTSGQDVQAGALLVQLTNDADVASLRALQAAAQQAATVLKRDRAQLKVRAISQAVVDADASELKTKRAQATQQAAIVARKSIRAPFAGRLGIAALNPGQYINPGDVLVTLQTLDPIYVDFFLPQQQLAGLAVGQVVTVSVDTFGDKQFSGKITAINPKVDAKTRNVQVQATLANPGRKLLPGMFAEVKVDVGQTQEWITVPQTAITYNPYGSTVFVIEEGKGKDAQSGPASASAAAPANGDNGNKRGKEEQLTVEQVFVTAGPTRGDQVAITKGLVAGQRIVTSGQLKLKNGTPVVIDNSVQPADDPNPTPQEK